MLKQGNATHKSFIEGQNGYTLIYIVYIRVSSETKYLIKQI